MGTITYLYLILSTYLFLLMIKTVDKKPVTKNTTMNDPICHHSCKVTLTSLQNLFIINTLNYLNNIIFLFEDFIESSPNMISLMGNHSYLPVYLGEDFFCFQISESLPSV
jgi:hypothetical protein